MDDCPFWQHVRQAAQAGPGPRLLPIFPREPGHTSIPTPGNGRRYWRTADQLRQQLEPAALQEFRADYDTFLAAVAAAEGGSETVFIDGLKYSARLEALLAADFPAGGAIHLTRSADAFLASCMKNFGRTDALSVARYSMRYRLEHRKAAQLHDRLPMLELNYEALTNDVDGHLRTVFEFIGVEPMTLAQLQPHLLRPQHVIGNRSLLDFTGQVRAASRAPLGGWRGLVVRGLA